MTATRELLDELRERWHERMRWTQALREKYERDQTDDNWLQYREMMRDRDMAWTAYSDAMGVTKTTTFSDKDDPRAQMIRLSTRWNR